MRFRLNRLGHLCYGQNCNRLGHLCHGQNFSWLRTVCNGWCTTTRMHEAITWPCIFGCTGDTDAIRHYMECPVLWQLAREFVDFHEEAVGMAHRMCFVQPALDKLQALAFVCLLYHTMKNDCSCKDCHGYILPGRVIQHKASQVARHLIHLVSPR